MKSNRSLFSRRGGKILIFSVLGVSVSLFAGQAAIAADEFGTIAADDFGTIAADEFGTIAADEFGTIAADDFGAIPADDFGTIPADEFGTNDPRMQKRDPGVMRQFTQNVDTKSTEPRYDALLGTAKFKGTKTETEVTYEEKISTYTEPHTFYKSIFEDQSGWQTCCYRTLFGWRERCYWCPRIVEKNVAEVVEVERQRVERIPREVTREIHTGAVKPIVVHSRRPYVKKPAFIWDEPQMVAGDKGLNHPIGR